MRTGLIPGHNVDKLNIEAGMVELGACGWPATKDGENIETRTVIDYALQRWARGEEEAAERGAIDQSFHGIPFTCWRRVLAAALVGANIQTSTQLGEKRAHQTEIRIP